MGSWTVGRVANRLNRKFVGYDLRWYGDPVGVAAG